MNLYQVTDIKIDFIFFFWKLNPLKILNDHLSSFFIKHMYK